MCHLTHRIHILALSSARATDADTPWTLALKAAADGFDGTLMPQVPESVTQCVETFIEAAQCATTRR